MLTNFSPGTLNIMPENKLLNTTLFQSGILLAYSFRSLREQLSGSKKKPVLNTERFEFSIPPIRVLKPRVTPGDSLKPLQRWEGTVLAVTNLSFVARLLDLSAGGPEEEAEFATDDVAPDDRPLLNPGSAFYWTIGYRDTASGQ